MNYGKLVRPFLLLKDLPFVFRIYALITVVLAVFNGYTDALIISRVQKASTLIGSSSIDSNFSYFISLTLLIALASFFLRSLNDFLINTNSANIGSLLFSRAYLSILKLDYTQFQGLSTDLLLSRLQHTNKYVGCFLRPLQQIFVSLVVSIFVFLEACRLEPIPVTVLFFSIFLYYLTVSLLSSRYLKRLSTSIGHLSRESFRVISNSLKVFKSIKLDNNYKLYVDNVFAYDTKQRRLSAYASTISVIPRYLIDFLSICLFLFLISYLFFFANSLLDNALGTVSVLALLFQKLLPNAQSIFSNITVIKSNSYAIYDLEFLMSLRSAPSLRIEELQIDPKHPDQLASLSGPLIPHHISSISICDNSSLVITGPSGCGKTTILDSFLLLRSSPSFNLHVNPRFFTSIDQYHSLNTLWLESVAYVNQETLLPGTSIFQVVSRSSNLQPTTSEEYEWFLNCLSIVGLKYLIDTPPLNSISSTSGDGFLSGGEKQRLSIARAIYSRRPILVLDECTSQLDPNQSINILSQLLDLNHVRSVLAVVHDSSLIPLFDHHISL